MVKRKVAALEKLDADLYVVLFLSELSTRTNLFSQCEFAIQNPSRSQVRSSPLLMALHGLYLLTV